MQKLIDKTIAFLLCAAVMVAVATTGSLVFNLFNTPTPTDGVIVTAVIAN